MRLTGAVYGHGLAQQQGCPALPYEIIAPTNERSTTAQVASEVGRWIRTVDEYRALQASGLLTIDVLNRAEFGVDVVSTVLLNLNLGVCCQLVAADADGSILGAIIYQVVPPRDGSINLLVVDPLHLKGSPYAPQLRGVGTSLVAGAAGRMLAAGVTSIHLHPLDKEAERFWRARGFATCGLGGLLCLRGESAIRSLIGNCVQTPECASTDGCLLCGLPRAARERLYHLQPIH